MPSPRTSAPRARPSRPAAAATTTSGGGVATLTRPTARSGTISQIKPVLEFSGATYGFALINNAYQAVMQQGRTWVPVSMLPAFVVAEWLIGKGLLAPQLGMIAGGSGNGSGRVPVRSDASASTASKPKVSTSRA